MTEEGTQHRAHHGARREPERSQGPGANGQEGPDVQEAAAGNQDGMVSTLERQVKEERQRADANYGNWQRATADFINYKRRVEQEREEMARFANTSLVLNVLPAVDDLERALQHVDPEIEGTTWVDGVRQILRKLKGALAAAGVSEIAAEGEPFDPNLHEAIAEGEGEEGKVVTEAQRGYRLGNRVIRPAMVVVGRGSPKTAD